MSASQKLPNVFSSALTSRSPRPLLERFGTGAGRPVPPVLKTSSPNRSRSPSFGLPSQDPFARRPSTPRSLSLRPPTSIIRNRPVPQLPGQAGNGNAGSPNNDFWRVDDSPPRTLLKPVEMKVKEVRHSPSIRVRPSPKRAVSPKRAAPARRKAVSKKRDTRNKRTSK